MFCNNFPIGQKRIVIVPPRLGSPIRSGLAPRMGANYSAGMCHPLLVLLLIANLLACPFRCNSVATKAAMSEAPCRVVGCCCSHSDPVPASLPKDDIPIDDCGCHDCLCDGAVLETGLELPSSTTEIVACWYPIPLLAIASSSATELLKPCFQRMSGRYLNGRAARIAHQTWRI